MCLQYGWTHLLFLSSETGVCEFGAQTMVSSLREINVTVSEWIRAPDERSIITDAVLLDYLRRIRDRARSIISFIPFLHHFMR